MSWGVLVFKDALTGEVLWWKFIETETFDVYHEGRVFLESLGYTIFSVTGDGFTGIRSAFSDVPFQMCQVHMERIVTRGTTQKPKLEAGVLLWNLIRTIHTADRRTFERRFNLYLDMYRDFLNEKSINPLTGEKSWTHEDLRRAAHSLQRFLPYLFTFETNKDIPKTTNALEGHFSHLKGIVKIHWGLSRRQKQKVIHTILLASTTSPIDRNG